MKASLPNKFLVLFAIITFLFCVHPDKSVAGDCLKTIHKQAIIDAISIAPTDLKNILERYKDAMLDEFNSSELTHSVYNVSPFSVGKSYESYYKDIVEIAKDKDPRRYEYMAKLLTRITVFVFSKYYPLKTNLCDENRILKRASVIYDGYDTAPDYSKVSQSYFIVKHAYDVTGQEPQMLQFYNILVNEISDLWVTIWKDAGRDISGLPEVNTLVRGVDKIKETKKQGISVQTTEKENTEIQQKNIRTFTEQDIKKYNYEEQELEKRFPDPKERERVKAKIEEYDRKIQGIQKEIDRLDKIDKMKQPLLWCNRAKELEKRINRWSDWRTEIGRNEYYEALSEYEEFKEEAHRKNIPPGWLRCQFE